MGAPMDRTRIDEGVRRMRFESLLDRHERGEITQAEAAEMLGVAERTFRRWRDRYEEEGEAGLADRRLGRPSPRRAPAGGHAAAPGRLAACLARGSSAARFDCDTG